LNILNIEGFLLNDIEEMEDEWWNVLVEVIVNAKKKNDGDLALKKLEIIGCPLMSDEMKEILQCGITLIVNGIVMHPPQPTPLSLPKNRPPSQSRNRCCTLI